MEQAAKVAAAIKRVANFIQGLLRCKTKQPQRNRNKHQKSSGFAPKPYRARDSTAA
jgi:hypothetical protein